jgi:hypothetical protein
MDNSKKELKKQLTSLQEEIYRDYPSGFNFKVIMENMDSLIDPTTREAYDKIWQLYNKAPDCCTEDGEPYKDFNEYICKDLREGNIRDAILSQIFTITRESNIELRDTSLDTITKTDKSKSYFMLRYIYKDISMNKITFNLPDGNWMPVDTNYLTHIRDIFEGLKDYEMTNLINSLLGAVVMKKMSIYNNTNEFVAAICQPPEFQCINMKLISELEEAIKVKIDAETDSSLINAVNGVLYIMSFGSYEMVNVRRMIEL